MAITPGWALIVAVAGRARVATFMLLPDVFGIQLLGRRLMAVSPALDARGTFTRQELREGSAQHQREGRQAGNGCDEGDRAKCG